MNKSDNKNNLNMNFLLLSVINGSSWIFEFMSLSSFFNIISPLLLLVFDIFSNLMSLKELLFFDDHLLNLSFFFKYLLIIFSIIK